MSNARAKTIDMTQGPPLPLVLRFTLPVLLGNIFQQLYTALWWEKTSATQPRPRWGPPFQ